MDGKPLTYIMANHGTTAKVQGPGSYGKAKKERLRNLKL